MKKTELSKNQADCFARRHYSRRLLFENHTPESVSGLPAQDRKQGNKH
ncbi:MAG: hypothetical protein V7K64_16130 [Nostoc sp.]